MENLIGKKFGMLTVIKFLYKKHSKQIFLCKCDCGKEKAIYSYNLKNGNTKSCGCLCKENSGNYKLWKPIEKDGCLLIPLTQNMYTVIDKQYFNEIKNFGWSLIKSKVKNKFYAITRVNGKMIYMHKFIINILEKIVGNVDHIDGDGLNNRRSNLRLVTSSNNNWNQKKQKNKKLSSIYKGVHYENYAKRWKVAIHLNNKLLKSTYRKTEIEAAKQYDIWARKYFGEFACVNFPKENERGIL